MSYLQQEGSDIVHREDPALPGKPRCGTKFTAPRIRSIDIPEGDLQLCSEAECFPRNARAADSAKPKAEAASAKAASNKATSSRSSRKATTRKVSSGKAGNAVGSKKGEKIADEAAKELNEKQAEADKAAAEAGAVRSEETIDDTPVDKNVPGDRARK